MSNFVMVFFSQIYWDDYVIFVLDSVYVLCTMFINYLKELKLELPYNPAIPLLDIHLREAKTHIIDICTLHNSHVMDSVLCPSIVNG
jgi:hypothetical protein